MVLFLFNIVIYIFLLKESMYSCIPIVRPRILNVVHVFLLLSMYSYFGDMRRFDTPPRIGVRDVQIIHAG